MTSFGAARAGHVLNALTIVHGKYYNAIDVLPMPSRLLESPLRAGPVIQHRMPDVTVGLPARSVWGDWLVTIPRVQLKVDNNGKLPISRFEKLA